jgi:hypothetical protein
MEINEVISHANDNAEFKQGLINAIKEEGVIIRTPEEEQEFLQSYEKDKIDPRVRELGDRIEQDIENHFGIKKEPNEKYFDVLARAAKGVKEESAALKIKLDQLKKDGSNDDVLKRELQEQQTLYTSLKEEYDALKQSSVNELSNLKKQTLINGGLEGIRFKEGIAQSIVDTMKASAIDSLMKTETETLEDGKTVFLNADKTRMRNPENPAEYLTAHDLLKDKLKDVLHVGRKQTGAGTGEFKYQVNGDVVEVENIPASVDSRVKLMEYLKEKGIPEGSIEFTKIYDKVKAERKLPLQ